MLINSFMQVEKLKKQGWQATKPSAKSGKSNLSVSTSPSVSSPPTSPPTSPSSSSPMSPSLLDNNVVEDLKQHLFTWLTLALKFDRMAMRKLCSIFYNFIRIYYFVGLLLYVHGLFIFERRKTLMPLYCMKK